MSLIVCREIEPGELPQSRLAVVGANPEVLLRSNSMPGDAVSLRRERNAALGEALMISRSRFLP